MESKTCNAFPVMEDRPLCLHFAKRVQLFNFFIEKYVQTMAVATYIANEVLTCSPICLLSYFILKPRCKPFRHICKGSHILSLQFMIGHQEN